MSLNRPTETGHRSTTVIHTYFRANAFEQTSQMCGRCFEWMLVKWRFSLSSRTKLFSQAMHLWRGISWTILCFCRKSRLLNCLPHCRQMCLSPSDFGICVADLSVDTAVLEDDSDFILSMLSTCSRFINSNSISVERGIRNLMKFDFQINLLKSGSQSFPMAYYC